ncbi:MAG TPA: DinB family protein [Deinococcales bacterium]|nr:DinB family protein [Deinococcales bacterium]
MTGDWLDVVLLQREFAWRGEDWFVPLEKALDGLGARDAAWLPPGGGNTIRQTLAHVTFFAERLLCRLEGRPAPTEDTNLATFGPPGDPNDEAGWAELLERTRHVAEAIPGALRAYPGDPDQPLGGASRPLRDEVALWVAHDVYHTGQIVTLRKQQGSWPKQRE